MCSTDENVVIEIWRSWWPVLTTFTNPSNREAIIKFVSTAWLKYGEVALHNVLSTNTKVWCAAFVKRLLCGCCNQREEESH
jgi:hypothetical protein